jgi:hypothetical protein
VQAKELKEAKDRVTEQELMNIDDEVIRKQRKFLRFMGVTIESLSKGRAAASREYSTMVSLIVDFGDEPRRYGADMSREEWIERYEKCGEQFDESEYDRKFGSKVDTRATTDSEETTDRIEQNVISTSTTDDDIRNEIKEQTEVEEQNEMVRTNELESVETAESETTASVTRSGRAYKTT